MAYNNSVLPGAYNDLTYARYTPVVNQRPVKELGELYKKKGEDYTYVATAMNELDRAVANTPHISQDTSILEEASQQVKSAFSDFEQQGDLENKVLDTNKLVSNISKKLLAVQNRKANVDAAIKEATATDKDGNPLHSTEDISKWSYLFNKGIKPLQYNEQLDTYVGEALPNIAIPSKVNFSEKVTKVLNDWKANKISLTDSQGNLLERLNNGYLKAGDVTYTDDAELVNAARSYLMSDPDFMDKVNFDLMYEMDRMLSQEDGTYRNMTVDDLSNTFTGDLKQVSTELGLTGNKPLEQQLKDQDISPESLYRRIRLEQLTNNAIRLGVSKESFTQYDNKYLKDEMLLEALKWQNENRNPSGNKPIDNNAYIAIDRVATLNQLNPSDYNDILSGREASIQSLETNKIKLLDAKKNGVGSPEQLDILEGLVRKDQDNIENYERQLKNIREYIETESGFDFFPLYMDYKKENRDNSKSIISFQDYKDQVIDAFVQGDKFNIWENFISGTTPISGRIDGAAALLRESYGAVETKPYNVDYHRYLIEGGNKDSTKYLNFTKAKQKSFEDTPDNFVNGDRNFSTMIDEKFGMSLEDADLKKSTVIPLIESVNKRPGYIINVVDKEGTLVGKILANQEGDITNDSYIVKDLAVGEAYNRWADKDLSNLDIIEKGMYRKLSLNYIDNSPEGAAIDAMNLYAANAGEPIPLVIDGQIKFIVTPQEDILKDDIPEGEKKTYVPNLIYHLSTPDGKQYLTRDNEPMWAIPQKGDKPIDFNSPSEIKEIYGAGLLEKAMRGYSTTRQNPYMQYLNMGMQQQNVGEYTNISNIFGNNIKQGVSPYVTQDTLSNVQRLHEAYPTLFVTDGLREPDSDIGAEKSEHKKGKALDFRYPNNEMESLMSTPTDWNNFGIIKLEVHGQGANKHYHVVFQ